MKKLLALFISVVFILVNVNAQKLSKVAPKIIVIGIGEKNSTFDESQFPDLNVYYTPSLIVNNFGFSLKERTDESIKYATIPFYKSKKMVGDPYTGTPQFIIDFNSHTDRGITNFYMLFDNEGLCYSYGYDGNFNSLADDLKDVVKKGKTIKPAKKSYGFGRKQTIIGHELGDFTIQSIDGKTLELNSLLGEEAVLVLFFYLDPDLDANTQALSDEEAKNMTNSEITYYELYRQQVYDVTSILRSAEEEFFEMKFKKYKN